jgi:hypothetical protein
LKISQHKLVWHFHLLDSVFCYFFSSSSKYISFPSCCIECRESFNGLNGFKDSHQWWKREKAKIYWCLGKNKGKERVFTISILCFFPMSIKLMVSNKFSSFFLSILYTKLLSYWGKIIKTSWICNTRKKGSKTRS